MENDTLKQIGIKDLINKLRKDEELKTKSASLNDYTFDKRNDIYKIKNQFDLHNSINLELIYDKQYKNINICYHEFNVTLYIVKVTELIPSLDSGIKMKLERKDFYKSLFFIEEQESNYNNKYKFDINNLYELEEIIKNQRDTIIKKEMERINKSKSIEKFVKILDELFDGGAVVIR